MNQPRGTMDSHRIYQAGKTIPIQKYSQINLDGSIQAAEMRLLRSLKACIRLGRMRNYEIRKDLVIYSIKDNTESYRA
jgi:hypothetical protein